MKVHVFHRHASRALAALAAIAGLAEPLSAVDRWVTRYDDPEPAGCAPTDCSLREALIASRSSGTDDRILLSAGTYWVTRPDIGDDEDENLRGDLDLFDHRVEIRGVGANLTTISAAHSSDVFEIDDLGADDAWVRFVDLTIADGAVGDDDGAAFSAARVAITVERCEFRGHIESHPTSSVIELMWSATLQMNDSTIAPNNGVGLGISQASAVVVNSTLSAAGENVVQVEEGGAFRCEHCTIYALPGIDSAIHATGPDAEVELLNTALLGDCVLLAAATLQTLGGNLESPFDTCLLGPDDQVAVAVPGLGELGLSGGATRTRLPEANSPLLGGAMDASCASTDQRGAARSGADCETGATESAPTPPTPLFRDGFDQGDSEAWSTVEV